MLGLNLWMVAKSVLKGFIVTVNESNIKQINYGLMKEENFIINLWKNLTYWTYNEGKTVVVKTFMKAFNRKIYENLTTNDSKCHLNKLVDEYKR